MITIYGDPISGNCLKVKWTCEKLAIPFAWIDVNVVNRETRSDAFLAMNPAGQVPVIVLEDDRPLAQSIWEELAKPQPDDAEIQRLIDEMAAHRHAFHTATTAALERFLAAITPEQRAEFIKLMEDRSDPVGGPLRNNIGN